MVDDEPVGMNATAANLAAEVQYQDFRRFLYALEQLLRQCAVAHPIGNETLPEHDISMHMPLDNSVRDLFVEHMPVILTLLPEDVVVADKKTLETVIGPVASDIGAGFAFRAIDLIAEIERVALMRVEQKAMLVQHRRREG